MLQPSHRSPYFTELQCVRIKYKCIIDEKSNEDDD